MTLTVTPAHLVDEAERSARSGLLARHPSWERVPLKMIADVINGAPFPSDQFNKDGVGLPLLRIRDVGNDYTDAYYDGPYEATHLVTQDDVIVGMDGDFRVAIWRGPKALLNQRVCKIQVDTQYYNHRFLAYCLQGYLDEVWKHTSSVTVRHLSSKTIADMPLPLPPLAEQRRIVTALEDHLSRLDMADYSLSETEQRRVHLLESITGYARRSFDYSDQVDRAPEPTAVGVDDGQLPPIPSDWHWRRLGELAAVVGGVTKDAKKQSSPAFPEVPYLRVANVQRGRLDLSHVATIRVDPAKAAALALHTGDVLLNEGGDRDKLGRGWIWDGQVSNCIHQNHVFRARVNDGTIHPKLLSWHANSMGIWFERNGKQSVNLASISLSKIKLLPVPVPPREAQEAILRHIDTVLTTMDSGSHGVANAKGRSMALRRALLTEAFAGRLVPQDANDEPASVLLERIRNERAAKPNTKRARRTTKQKDTLL